MCSLFGFGVFKNKKNKKNLRAKTGANVPLSLRFYNSGQGLNMYFIVLTKYV